MTESTVTRGADDVRLARVHLRMGQLTLARAELEDLLRRDQLDTTSLAVLAEARWRTGDGAGAAEAAGAHLAAGGSDDIALCIAAEAAALDGRQDEARELMDRLPAADAGALDALFAGMPRRASWPAGPVDRSDMDELRRAADRGREAARRPGPVRTSSGESQTQLFRRAELEAAAEAEASAGSSAADAAPASRRRKAELDPSVELERARGELEHDPDRAFLRLALVLRHDPTRAPAVIDVLHLRREAKAALLRGDAQRLLGRHLEAEAAYDAAAESLEAS
ncbi:MAG TPA: hypothetical protein VJ850_02095 [Candidatus Limnocylindrales bacterium]|nr:hypothetical protein [Candidatus Limnocylindrales bacterium]